MDCQRLRSEALCSPNAEVISSADETSYKKNIVSSQNITVPSQILDLFKNEIRTEAIRLNGSPSSLCRLASETKKEVSQSGLGRGSGASGGDYRLSKILARSKPFI